MEEKIKHLVDEYERAAAMDRDELNDLLIEIRKLIDSFGGNPPDKLDFYRVLMGRRNRLTESLKLYDRIISDLKRIIS